GDKGVTLNHGPLEGKSPLPASDDDKAPAPEDGKPEDDKAQVPADDKPKDGKAPAPTDGKALATAKTPTATPSPA
ncbi:865_t:CDS:1, partial [Funneliformis mosseae]